MSVEDLFPGIQDFLVLTSKHLVGRFEPGGGFRVFERLSESVAAHARRLLDAYSTNAANADIRPAIVIPPMPDRKWRTASLVFDDQVLHRLYPSGGGERPEELTPFQARNRERSIYQGMEILIGYENKSMPGVAFYCPVLYGHSGRLREYQEYARNLAGDVPPDTPVFEVLNFIALLTPTERRSDWARELVRLIQNISIQSNRRAGSSFTLTES